MIRFLQTPGKTKKIVLGGLLVIICGAMVITLIPGGILGDALGVGAPQGATIAKVGDYEVSVPEVDQMARSMGKQQFPRGLPSQFLPFLRQRAAEVLIVQKAMLNEAERLGLKVTDAELQEEMQHGQLGPTLFPGGVFVGSDMYESFVSQQFQMSVPAFEKMVKDEIMIRKLRSAVQGPITVSEGDIANEYTRENLKVKFDYAVITLDDIEKQIHPTEADLKAYYEQHKSQYTNSIPEKRKVRYILVDTAKLKDQVQVTPQDLQNYYNQHREEYRVPDQVEVRHILIKTPDPGPDGKVDEKAVEAARQKAESILKQVQNGGNFAELAKKYSEDPGSKDKSGSLGWVQKGQTAPEFDQAAFALNKGQTSGLVRTTFGFHIIHVDDKQQVHVKSLDEVKAQIAPIIAADKAGSRADALTNKVETEARTAGFDKAGKDNGLQVVETGFFSRTDSLPGLGNVPDFMSAVFNAREKSPPESVHIQQGYAIYQVTGVQQPRTPSFEEIRARVEQESKSDRAGEMLAKQTQELADRARALHDLRKAAKELGATVKTSDLVSTTGQVPD